MTCNIGHNCKLLVGEGATEVNHVGGDERLPYVGHSHFQLAPQWTTLTHLCTKTKPIRGAYGVSANTHLRKVVTTQQEEMPKKQGY